MQTKVSHGFSPWFLGESRGRGVKCNLDEGPWRSISFLFSNKWRSFMWVILGRSFDFTDSVEGLLTVLQWPSGRSFYCSCSQQKSTRKYVSSLPPPPEKRSVAERSHLLLRFWRRKNPEINQRYFSTVTKELRKLSLLIQKPLERGCTELLLKVKYHIVRRI